ncbi:glycosyltransferase family 39 protein [Pseudarthrobacter sp. NamE2]|uniref:glycosyltransferase family 39 protein n=1 Tax=Pseudarthrobacter sp. NamE2 TaxID=2576838 RepID=UPI0014858EFD|nr:glycosyltransferase family 39 protein [Pseudarthrobacter sp. NamE2]
MALAVVAAAVYSWDLTVNGWGNPYYAAAAQAGAQDWSAFFFGSADAGNGLSVDKPPLHLWLMASFVKAFGLSFASVLIPQALMGVATVLLVHGTVLNWAGRRQAFMAGLFVVLTPVTSIVFRFNNPDALLLLLWAATVYLSVRAVKRSRARDLYLAAFVLGLAFLCKQFQSWILAPAIIASIFAFGFDTLMMRVRRLLLAGLVMLTPAVAWIAAVELTPPSSRPWIGGSTTNSFLELTFGYNGLGRLTGHTSLGAVNPKDFDGVVGHDASLIRLVTINYAPEIAWYLPLAVAAAAPMAIGLWNRRYTRIESYAATLILIWFATTFSIVSFMTGDIHPYYTAMLVLPMAFLSAHACEQAWTRRTKAAYARGAAFTTLVCVFLASGILTWFHGWNPWAANAIKLAALASACVLLLPRPETRPLTTKISLLIAGVSIVLVPGLFIGESIRTPQQGSFPISGPVPTAESWHKRDAEQLRLGEKTKYALARGEPVIPQIAALIESAQSDVRWAAATTGSENAALYQLSTERPIMSIGGFSALDSFPALPVFQQYVSDRSIRYYIHQPGILHWSAGSNTLSVVTWIESNFNHQEFDGVRLYDLRSPLHD